MWLYIIYYKLTNKAICQYKHIFYWCTKLALIKKQKYYCKAFKQEPK